MVSTAAASSLDRISVMTSLLSGVRLPDAVPHGTSGSSSHVLGA
jgi:hypothetical protein